MGLAAGSKGSIIVLGMQDGSAESLHRLEEALAARARWLETTRLPQLKDLLGSYRSLFASISGTLLRKGLLREDQYHYAERVSEVAAPPDSTLSETGDSAELSNRMVSYGRQLDFLVDGMPFTLASLDLPTVRRIASVMAFVDWDGFGETSHSPTTRALARLVTKVRLSKDTLSSRVLNESQSQIEKIHRVIQERLVELESWHRESWKGEVRAKVLPHVASHAHGAGADRAATVLAVRKVFELSFPNGTWHPHLVQEILAEDYGPGSAERMEKLIASLAVPIPETAKSENVLDGRAELMQAVRSVCASAADLSRCDSILQENEHALEKRHLTLSQRVRRWLQKSLGRLDDRFYDVETAPASSDEGPKTETIDFLKFRSELKELNSVFAEINQKESPGQRRIDAMEEEELGSFLDWQVRQLRRLHRRMESLNALFQVRALHERRVTVRSIKLELLAIENCVIRAEEVSRGWAARA